MIYSFLSHWNDWYTGCKTDIIAFYAFENTSCRNFYILSVQRVHSFSAYAKLSEKLRFLTLWRNVSFSEKFAYVLNEGSQSGVMVMLVDLDSIHKSI